MEYYLILARSVTYAQRMQKTLDRQVFAAGFSARPEI